MAEPLFRRLALIGIGLIGSSVARIARERGDLAAEVVVTARTAKTLERVRELDFADRIEADPAQAVAGADCVMLCAPVGAFADIATAIAPRLEAGAVLTDVGSTKQSVIRDVGPLVPAGVHFVPAHPVAGTEYSGPDSGFTTLFEGRWTLLTPPPGTDEAAVAKVEEFWRRCGSMVQRMEPAHHDRVLAIVSHLPHLLAFTICGTADDLADESRQAVLQFAASGFRDFTRIAASDPVMWRDIFLNNREALLEMLARFVEDAQAMSRAVRWGDAAYIEDKVERGRKIRRSLIELKQASNRVMPRHIRSMNRRDLLRLRLAPLLLAAPAARAQPAFRRHRRTRPTCARIETYLDGLRTLKANFLQVAPNGATSQGTVWLERPGRMRFQMTRPARSCCWPATDCWCFTTGSLTRPPTSSCRRPCSGSCWRIMSTSVAT